MKNKLNCKYSGYIEFYRCEDSISLQMNADSEADIMVSPKDLKGFCLELIKLCEDIQNER